MLGFSLLKGKFVQLFFCYRPIWSFTDNRMKSLAWMVSFHKKRTKIQNQNTGVMPVPSKRDRIKAKTTKDIVSLKKKIWQQATTAVTRQTNKIVQKLNILSKDWYEKLWLKLTFSEPLHPTQHQCCSHAEQKLFDHPQEQKSKVEG